MRFDVPSLLITDDDRSFRETLRDVFEPRGFRTLLAADGDEALQIVHRESVQLLVLDMHMPRVTGLETMRAVRRLPRAIPCILLSAQLDETIISAARKAEAFSVMPKPVSLADLTGIVNRAMRSCYDWPRAEKP